jgi:hypothetical protein
MGLGGNILVNEFRNCENHYLIVWDCILTPDYSARPKSKRNAARFWNPCSPARQAVELAFPVTSGALLANTGSPWLLGGECEVKGAHVLVPGRQVQSGSSHACVQVYPQLKENGRQRVFLFIPFHLKIEWIGQTFVFSHLTIKITFWA